jgi:predicted phage baseplate assembly protein
MMSLQVPNLDDRTFQQIVSETRSKIPLYCPKWTDYNLSDPGVTLIELFAGMVEMLLYRLNQVPEKNYVKFMELIGIKLQPPVPAVVNITFRLSAPQPEAVTIPEGTEVSTVRTETQEAISFTTGKNATILVPNLTGALTTFDDVTYNDVFSTIKNPYDETAVFPDLKQKNNAFYLGYNEDLSAHTLALSVQSSIEGIGVDPSNPPWAWEYWDKELGKWLLMRLETDTTGGFNTSGQIILHIPLTAGEKEINGKTALWIRCRSTEPLPGQGRYGRSPTFKTILSESIGYTVSASHGSRIKHEVLGRSDGGQGQKFQLQNTPVLQRTPGETIEVETETEGKYEQWLEVPDFAGSGPDDRHFTCDSVSGEVQFGPSIRHPSGEERQYGKVPQAGRWIRFTSYRTGGGVIGNVGLGTITVLKSSIPYVASVTNINAAKGGTDTETLESAKLRAPRTFMESTRAVTQEDYEKLTLKASNRVARAKCISGLTNANNIQPGTVRVLVVPSVVDNTGYIPPENLRLLPGLNAEILAYLDKRRLLATRLEIMTPEYTWVSVKVQVKAKTNINHEQLSIDIEEKLCGYINPLTGGETENGWPFGRNISSSDVYKALQGVTGIEYIREVQMFPVKEGNRQGAASIIELSGDSLPCSFRHEIIVS